MAREERAATPAPDISRQKKIKPTIFSAPDLVEMGKKSRLVSRSRVDRFRPQSVATSHPGQFLRRTAVLNLCQLKLILSDRNYQRGWPPRSVSNHSLCEDEIARYSADEAERGFRKP